MVGNTTIAPNLPQAFSSAGGQAKQQSTHLPKKTVEMKARQMNQHTFTEKVEKTPKFTKIHLEPAVLAAIRQYQANDNVSCSENHHDLVGIDLYA